MIRKFIWQPWSNQILADECDVDDNDYHDEYDERPLNKGFSILPIGIGTMNMTQTPFGMVPADSVENLLSQKFDLWVLHTNFDITEDIVNIVELIPGVETLDVMTRYRLRVGFPNVDGDTESLFNVQETQDHIEQVILNFFTYQQDVFLDCLTKPEIVYKTKEFRDYLLTKHENWTMYVLPNGSMEVVISDDDGREFNNKIKLFIETQKLVGGIILVSDDREV